MFLCSVLAVFVIDVVCSNYPSEPSVFAQGLVTVYIWNCRYLVIILGKCNYAYNNATVYAMS